MRVPRPKRIRGGRRWLGRLLAGLALIIAIAIVVVVVANAGSSTPNASGNASKPTGSTTIQRRNLVETDTESGTLSYNRPQTVYNRMSGTITWLPQVGQVIKPGQTLYKVDGQPVLLMDGTTPAYRDLGPSDSDGADIEELNRNLVKLGFNAANITVDDVWQAATTEGVDLLQESLGEAETGTLTLGRIVFLPGDQLVTTVDGTLGSTGGTNASATVAPSPEFVDYTVPEPSGAPSAHKAAKAPKAAKCPSPNGTTSPNTTGNTTPSATSTTPTQLTTGKEPSKCKSKKSGKPTAEQQLQALLALLKAETQQLKSNHGGSPGGGSPSSGSGNPSGSHSGSGNSGSGNSGSGNSGSGNSGSGNSGSGNSGSGTATAILQTTSTQLVVTVDLAATVQSEAVDGEHVTVEMPNGDVVTGKITAVSPVAQSSSNDNNGSGNGGNGGSGNGNSGNGNSGNGSSSTIPVTIALSGHNTGAGLDQASVSVNFVQQKATNVLSVPVTALLATGGGNYAVQEAAAPHTLIPVTTGLFAAGYVEIAGSGIYTGLAVTDSQG
jgi:membrane fusion protein, multidrug efflux system